MLEWDQKCFLVVDHLYMHIFLHVPLSPIFQIPIQTLMIQYLLLNYLYPPPSSFFNCTVFVSSLKINTQAIHVQLYCNCRFNWPTTQQIAYHQLGCKCLLIYLVWICIYLMCIILLNCRPLQKQKKEAEWHFSEKVGKIVMDKKQVRL